MAEADNRVGNGDGETLGPTGEYPEGKLTPDDSGELRIGVGIKEGKVVIFFGSFISWFGMGKQGALNLAAIIKQRAEELP